ncbi:hypothetical protein ACOSP7_005151 [Xanthoceras sorbifolium]
MFAFQLGRNMEIYVDDMLTKSVRDSDHYTDLRETFDVICMYDMRLNPEKGAFDVSSRKFLGFMVNQRGFSANLDKIKAIQELRNPRTTKEIQGLTGQIVALSRFVSRMTDLCLPFFQALKKNSSSQWNINYERAFRQLKQYLANPLILAKPNHEEMLYVYLAVPCEAISSVLIKEDHGVQRVVYYISKTMTGPKTRYPEVEKLVLALIISVRKLRPYFQAHPITVLNNYPLRQILQKMKASGRIVKWAVELSEFKLTHRPRTAIKGQAIADFISEFSSDETATTFQADTES